MSLPERIVTDKPLSFVLACVLGILLFLIDLMLKSPGNNEKEL